MFRRFLKTIGSLTLAFTLLFSLNLTAFAYMEIETDRTGSITVSPQSGQSLGSELTIYKVADVVVENADQKYTLTIDFAGSGVDLTSLDNSDSLAATLFDYVGSKNLTGTTKSITGSGSVKFDGLSLGLYLIAQKTAGSGGAVVNPFLVSVPMKSEDGESWVYDVNASPKAESYATVDVTVNKVWNDGKDTSFRPASISVSLYKGGNLVDTVTLSSSNSWSYTWSGLEKSDSYSVSEAAVSGYAATYSQSGYTFTITNTPKLVQTGQLNWPVPVLAGGGVALFAVGWALVNLKKKKG